jgi:hypothetical protein
MYFHIFDQLANVHTPHFVTMQYYNPEFLFCRCEKLTKINILHVTINYIRALQSILDTGDAGVQIYGTSVVQSPFLPIHEEAEKPDEKIIPKNNPPKSANPTTTLRRGNGKKPLRVKNPSASSTASSSEDSGILEDEDGDGDGDGDEEMSCPDWTELTSTLELIPPRGNLDTLLSSTGAATGSSKILQPKDFNRIQNPPLLLIDVGGFSDLGIFSDLNSSFDSNSLDEGVILPQFEEDPFELVF